MRPPRAEGGLDGRSEPSRGWPVSWGTAGTTGNYTAARVLQQQIADASERVLRAEHRDTVTACGNLAG
jgi:hypothetical protein